jgi:CDP-paratose synthetase
MKTLLITGINGFLGSHLAKQLSSYYNIIGLEYETDNLYRLEGLSIKIYSYKQDQLEKIFSYNEIFAIIHAATIYYVIEGKFDRLIQCNLILPIKLFSLADNFKVDLFINIDSFFNNPKYNYHYLSEYTLSKKNVVEWLRIIKRKSHIKLINMKLFHIYGPFDSPDKFVPKLLSSLKSNQFSIDFTRGKQKRDFIYINDVVSAIKTVLVNHARLDIDFNQFEVGSGKATTIKKFIEIAKEVTQANSILNFGKLEYRNNEIMYSKANIKELNKLGWSPIFSLEDGIRNTFVQL